MKKINQEIFYPKKHYSKKFLIEKKLIKKIVDRKNF